MSLAVIMYRHMDGRVVPFTHPDATAERRAAIAHWKGNYEMTGLTDEGTDGNPTETDVMRHLCDASDALQSASVSTSLGVVFDRCREAQQVVRIAMRAAIGEDA